LDRVLHVGQTEKKSSLSAHRGVSRKATKKLPTGQNKPPNGQVISGKWIFDNRKKTFWYVWVNPRSSRRIGLGAYLPKFCTVFKKLISLAPQGYFQLAISLAH
jgi:hypothetical protein